MPVEVYNIENYSWIKLFNFDAYRHASWMIENYIFCHGGSTFTNPQVSNDEIKIFNIDDLQIPKMNSSNTNINNSNNMKTTSEITLNNSSEFEEKLDNKNELENKIVIDNKILIDNKLIDINSLKLDKNNLINELHEQICNPIEISRPLISISKNLGEKSGKIKKITQPVKNLYNSYNTENANDDEPLYEKFIKALLQPNEWKNKKKIVVGKFPFRPEHILALTKACQEVVMSQPIVLELSTPIKVFGDIHGQYDDLLRFFEFWGDPSDGQKGDIKIIDYLFIGDFVDRGSQSLEVICLLMSLKLKYPDNIHLIRGNHEDKLINKYFGFYQECDERLYEDFKQEDQTVFHCVNEFFEYLPLAALIDNQVICLHGGIGGSLTSVEEIRALKRPLEIVHDIKNIKHQIVMDILWSDPTDNDSILGIQPNLLRDTGKYGNIVKYGPDKVEKFLKDNNLNLIIRAHECGI